MKPPKSILLFILFITIFGNGNAQNIVVKRGERPPIDMSTIPEAGYEHKKIRIKFKSQYARLLESKQFEATNKGESVRFGISTIDKLNQAYSVTKAKQLFWSEALGYTFTEKHKAWGFHLWFELEFVSHRNDLIAIIETYGELPEIEVAEPIYKIKLIGNDEVPDARVENSPQDKQPEWTPNDPRFAEQWHYHNTGQQSGTPDKDIDLPEAWEIEKGNSNVIVAIIDGGIQYNHPDIAGNMWPGIGYNFVISSSTIEPDAHGTHVAGTVAAVNSNGIGVSGVAGGSGSNDGVRLMSCQVFNATDAGGFHLAPVYAADNGASISQNSWGYTVVGGYNQAELDAIDYFNTNGGGTSLTGGITIFAAGNDGSSGQWYPGCYSGAFSVAATNNNDQKAWYSNYDTWIDISAPGGETNSVTSRGVLSTLTGSNYGFYQGTSMACPHASGVAALAVSLAYGQLTANNIADILRASTDDHYAQNPSYIGKLGTGRLNAYQALLETQTYLSGVFNPTTFTATAVSTSQIDLSWTKNLDNDDVMIVWSPSSSFGIPTEGVAYTSGQSIPGGGTVLYNGGGNGFIHSGLIANTQYFYKAFSVNASFNYSSGRGATTYTQCGTFATLPFSQDFNSSSSLPNCWSITDNQGSGQVWQIGVMTGQTPIPALTGNYAFLNSDGYGSGNSQNTDLITPLMDLSSYANIVLDFKHYFKAYTGSSAKLSYSINGGASWTQIQQWTATTPINPTVFSQTIAAVAGQSQVKFKWNYTGTWGYFWVIDDIQITGTSGGSLPTTFNFSGGGSYCQNAVLSGVNATLSSSESGVSYQLLNNSVVTGSPQIGTGNALTWNNLTSGAYTVSATNGTGTVVMNGTVTVTEEPLQAVSVVVIAGQNPVCQGTNVTFTATPTNGGSTPIYQWLVNNLAVGTNAASYNYEPLNGDQIKVVMTSSLTCTLGSPATSNTIDMTVNANLPSSVSITASQSSVCQGTPVIFTAFPENGGSTPAYQWKVNGQNAGTNNSNFAYTPVNGDQVQVVMTSSLTCVTGNPASSNVISMTISNNQLASVSITASQTNVCQGTPVTFTAFPENGGSTPTYQWKVNGQNAGTNNSTFAYTPVNGDQVQVVMTSSLTCITGNPAPSNVIAINVSNSLAASVSITATQTVLCQGTTVTFSAFPLNGGSSPTYQWKVNGQNSGSNNSTFAYIPANGDQVQTVMTSTLECVSENPASSNTIELTVHPVELTLITNPNQGGTASYTGIPQIGQTVNLTAVAANGWAFNNWSNSSGEIISTNANYNLTVTECNQALTANFNTLNTITGKLAIFNPYETPVPTPYSGGAFYAQLFDGQEATGASQQITTGTPFNFTGLETGKSYTVRLWEQTTDNLVGSSWSWNNYGGVTALDALIVSYMGIQNPVLSSFPWISPIGLGGYTPFFKQVADANNSNSITSLDALFLLYRSINDPVTIPFPGGKHNFQIAGKKLSSFNEMVYPNAPDIILSPYGTYSATSPVTSVYYETSLPVIESGENIFNIYLVATGDMNVSNLLQNQKSPTSTLNFKGVTIANVNNELIVPLSLNQKRELASATTGFRFKPDVLNITDVIGVDIFYIDNHEGIVRIAWMAENGRYFEESDQFLSLKIKILKEINEGEPFIELLPETEFSDKYATILNDICLTTSYIETSPASNSELRNSSLYLMAFPNPFTDLATLKYSLPENGIVHIKVFNSQGQVVKQFENELMTKGMHSLMLRQNDMTGPGLYLCELTYKSNNYFIVNHTNIMFVR